MADALERDPHTIGEWLTTFRQAGPVGLSFEHTGGSPALNGQQQAALKAAVQAPPATAGIQLADWNWKVVREFVQHQFGSTLSRSRCLQYLHRLDFVLMPNP